MLPQSIAARTRPDAEIEEWEWPEVDELFEAKWFAEQLGVPSGLYGMETFAGRVEYEWAWEFGPRERVFKYNETTTTTETRFKPWFFPEQRSIRHHRAARVLELDGDQIQSRSDTSVLQRFLTSLGVPMPSPVFAPHVRGFEWDRYRV